MPTLATPPLLKAENAQQQQRHKKQPYQAPSLMILSDTDIDGSIYELQEADAGNGNGAAS